MGTERRGPLRGDGINVQARVGVSETRPAVALFLMAALMVRTTRVCWALRLQTLYGVDGNHDVPHARSRCQVLPAIRIRSDGEERDGRRAG